MPISSLPSQIDPESNKRLCIAAIHEVGDQALGIEQFVASSPYHAERGFNYLTGRQNYTFAKWNEQQSQFFNKAADWMYRAIPTDTTHPDYLMYRRGVGIASLVAGGYGAVRGGIKLAQWGTQAWRLKKGIFVAGEKLGSFKTSQITPVNFFKNKTYPEIEQLLTKKLGTPRGIGPHNKSFYNSKTKRTFNLHQDPLHHEGKAHIDIRKRGLPSDYYAPFFLKE